MSENQFQASPEFWDLLDAACEDSLTVHQAEQLEQLLRSQNGSQAREVYEAYMQLNFELYYQSRTTAASQRNRALCQEPCPDSKSSVIRLMAKTFESSKGHQILAAGALVMFVIAVGIVFSLRWNGNQRAQNNPTDKPETEIPKSASRCIAHFIGDYDSIWSKEIGALVSGQELFEGQRLSLDRGIAQIRFSSGAEFTLEGRCTIRLEGNRRAVLERGKLVGHVPPEAAGFVVDTPLAKVTDMGTRFGIACEDSHSTEVHVFEGLIRVDLHSDQADESLKGRRYAAREAVRLEGLSGGIVDAFAMNAAPREFHHELPFDRGGLVAQYEFESDLADSSGNYHRGMMLGEGRIENDQLRGSVLHCPNKSSGVNIDTVVPIPAFPANCSITLAAWIQQTSKSSGSHEYIIQLGANGDSPVATLGILPSGRVRGYLETDQTGLDQVEVTSAGSVPTSSINRSWHHVAIVYDRESDEAVFYIDAIRDSSDDSIRGIYDTSAFSWHGATIGTGTNSNAYFHGKIDDARIYSRALSEQEVKELVKFPSRSN